MKGEAKKFIDALEQRKGLSGDEGFSCDDVSSGQAIKLLVKDRDCSFCFVKKKARPYWVVEVVGSYYMDYHEVAFVAVVLAILNGAL